MKIVLNSYTGMGAWFMLRLLEEGHSVDYNFTGNYGRNNLRGLVPMAKEVKDFSAYDLSIFDLTGKPKLAERSKEQTPTIGDGELSSKLEDDRLFGVQVMESCGVQVPPYEVFDDLDAARKYITKHKKRYVFKPNGGQDQSSATTYVSTGYKDLLDYLDKLGEMTKGEEFLLQEFVENGTEISTEAYFNGEDFYFVNATLEEKKFMDGNIGPNTGCSGNLVWAYEAIGSQPWKQPRVFEEGLAKLKDYLGMMRYRGMVDLNSIVTETELYGLEWTPRFGYDASATLFSLMSSDLGEFLYAISAGEVPEYSLSNKYAAAVRVSLPPYPSELKGKHPAGVPIQGIVPEDLKHHYILDAMISPDGDLVTSGEGFGCVIVPIAASETMNDAFQDVHKRIKKLKIPDMQYRTDIEKFTLGRYLRLEREGWLR